jgi:hypothetical protein
VKIVNGFFFENENRVSANETCEIYMNSVIEERFERNPIVQIKTRKNLKGEN